MSKSSFVYEIYIKSSAQSVWQALLDGKFTRQYWGYENVSDWQPGSTWEHRKAGAQQTVAILGEVLEAAAPHRLVISWVAPQHRGDKAQHSRVTFEIQTLRDMVRLTVTHDELQTGSDMHRSISAGWPRVLSSLKTLLETGTALDTWRSR